MKKMSAPLLVLAVLAPSVSAAPAPDRAKKKLDVLKRKLPGVAQQWVKDRWLGFPEAEVRLVRQTSPTEAKVTVLLPCGNDEDGPRGDKMLTVYIRFYDEAWTSTDCRTTWKLDSEDNLAVHKLMLAIDELGEK